MSGERTEAVVRIVIVKYLLPSTTKKKKKKQSLPPAFPRGTVTG